MMVRRYLRVKRYNQTYFVMCQPNDTFAFIKQQVALANTECLANHMRLILPKDNIVLQDEEKVEKYGDDIKNETELYVVFKISDEEWESIAIAETQSGFGGDGP